MDFFEEQDRARQQSRVLVGLFLLATLGLVLAIDGIVLGLLWLGEQGRDSEPVALTELARSLLLPSLGTLALIGGASAYKFLKLAKGGGAVARELGGTYVRRSETGDAKRRLLNVVDEMAIASGLPVPQVYVLEDDTAINAFAAGFEPGNAAISVTRGTLDTLSRDELQGVIAHEFSHILNGDMRLNMQMTGLLHGLVGLGVAGRWVLRWTRVRGGGRFAVLLFLVCLKLAIVSAVGVFFGRMIKAAVSRKRELLADASAVRLTREPGGLAGALKKVLARHKALPYAAALSSVRAEEVSHMLFAWGGGSSFSTHPPLEQRIRALEPDFDPGSVRPEPGAPPAEEVAVPQPPAAGLRPEEVGARIGNPTAADVEHAVSVLDAVPVPLREACASPDGAVSAVLALLLSADALTQNAQLEWLSQQLGASTASRVEALEADVRALGRHMHLPVLELAQPALTEAEPAQRVSLERAVTHLRDADGGLGPFELVVSRIARAHVAEAKGVRPRRWVSLSECRAELAGVLATLAEHGASGPEEAAAAYAAGITRLPGSGWPRFDEAERRLSHFEGALERLDALGVTPKRRVVEATTAVIASDGKVEPAEAELLRVVCDALRCPLPLAFAVQTPEMG